ncbi:MAG: PKD domain-containing protein [Bacteroidetes bacterium]|nr:PKD domain-containing protein [Bacteroidota bacterium]
MRYTITFLMLTLTCTSNACDNLFLLLKNGYSQNLTKTYSALSLNNRKAILAKWDFGDGNKGSGKTVNHTFAAEGKYLISLYAYDSVASCWDTVTLEDCVLDVATTVTQKGSSIDFSIPSKSRRYVNWFIYSGSQYQYYTNPASHPVANGMPLVVQLTYYDTVLGCGNTDSVDVSTLNPASRNEWVQPKVQIWPQPASDLVRFQWPGETRPLSIELRNLYGQLVYKRHFPATALPYTDISVSGFPDGMYTYQIITTRGHLDGRILVAR